MPESTTAWWIWERTSIFFLYLLHPARWYLSTEGEAVTALPEGGCAVSNDPLIGGQGFAFPWLTCGQRKPWTQQ